MTEGAFEHLEGEGRTLDLSEDSQTPEHLRMAYRILKNAGYVPAEVTLRHQIAAVEQELMTSETSEGGIDAWKRLAVLRMRLGSDLDLRIEAHYHDALMSRLARGGLD